MCWICDLKSQLQAMGLDYSNVNIIPMHTTCTKTGEDEVIPRILRPQAGDPRPGRQIEDQLGRLVHRLIGQNQRYATLIALKNQEIELQKQAIAKAIRAIEAYERMTGYKAMEDKLGGVVLMQTAAPTRDPDDECDCGFCNPEDREG
jgi:hypothetical protein